MRRLDTGEVERLRWSYDMGIPVRDAALEHNCSMSTISKYYAVFKAEAGQATNNREQASSTTTRSDER